MCSSHIFFLQFLYRTASSVFDFSQDWSARFLRWCVSKGAFRIFRYDSVMIYIVCQLCAGVLFGGYLRRVWAMTVVSFCCVSLKCLLFMLYAPFPRPFFFFCFPYDFFSSFFPPLLVLVWAYTDSSGKTAFLFRRLWSL